MRRLISSSALLVALVSCLFILPACDSGGSNSDDGDGGGGGGGGGGSGTTVTATDENKFNFSFSGGSSSASKDPDPYEGFAFSWSGETPDGEQGYAIYFSSKKTFDPEAVSSGSGPAIAGVLLAKGSKSPSGSFSIADFENNGSLDVDQSGGLIVKGFDQSDNQGPRTIQIFTGGSIDFSDGNVTGFTNVTSTEIVFDFDADEENRVTKTEGVNVNLNGSINPAEGVPNFLDDQTFRVSTN